MFNSAKAASAKNTPNLQPVQNAKTAINGPAQQSNPISIVNSAPKFSPVSSGAPSSAPFSVPAFKPQITKPKEAPQEVAPAVSKAPATQNSFSSFNTSGGLSFGANKTQELSFGESKGFGFGSPASR